jgi:hypothetical protein
MRIKMSQINYGEVLIVGGKYKGRIGNYDDDDLGMAICYVCGVGEVNIRRENLIDLDFIKLSLAKEELRKQKENKASN